MVGSVQEPVAAGQDEVPDAVDRLRDSGAFEGMREEVVDLAEVRSSCDHADRAEAVEAMPLLITVERVPGARDGFPALRRIREQRLGVRLTERPDGARLPPATGS